MISEINGRNIKLLINSSEISRRVEELGEKITKDYEHKPLVIIGVLKGSFVFLADLIRNIGIDAEVDFIGVSSYKDSMSPGKIELTQNIKIPLKNKDVLLVEDLLDTGGTLAFIRDRIISEQPASIKICALIKKKKSRKADITVDYLGFEIKDDFIVGYGTDLAEKGRSLPDIYVLE